MNSSRRSACRGRDPEQGLVYAIDRKENVVGVDLETRRVRSFLERCGTRQWARTARCTRWTRAAPSRSWCDGPRSGSGRSSRARRRAFGTMGGALSRGSREKGGARGARLRSASHLRATACRDRWPRACTATWSRSRRIPPWSSTIRRPSGRRASSGCRVMRSDVDLFALRPSSLHRPGGSRPVDPRSILRRRAGPNRLPGPSKELRRDEYGQWLLVRPAEGDSVWVVDVGRVAHDRCSRDQMGDATFRRSPRPTRCWSGGRGCVGLNLAAETFPETGRVKDGAADLWLPLRWRSAARCRGTGGGGSGKMAAGTDSAAAAPSVYLQVSSSQNPTWANELSEKLKAAGFRRPCCRRRGATRRTAWCSVPYATREQAEEAARRSACLRSWCTPHRTPPRGKTR